MKDDLWVGITDILTSMFLKSLNSLRILHKFM